MKANCPALGLLGKQHSFLVNGFGLTQGATFLSLMNWKRRKSVKENSLTFAGAAVAPSLSLEP